MQRWPGRSQGQGRRPDANPTMRRSSPPRRPTVALGALYDRYARLIYRYRYARLGTREAAEDATTEVP
ncbi:MAG: hypothetical protein U0841_20405 [Chloroflexia bacterium]